MMRMQKIKIGILALMFFLPGLLSAQSRSSMSLNGEWIFATDPVGVGEMGHWFAPELNTASWDKVSVPHCFSVDKRYEFYTGKAWYFKRWEGGAASEGMHQWLHFDAVFYKAKVWLNGQLLGGHEGGYTPFEFDVTGHVQGKNLLVVEVDNSWDTTTIPGAKTPANYQGDNMGQWYPWINYGGITRPVSLVSRPDVFVKSIKIVTDPDLKKGSAKVQVLTVVSNLSGVKVARDLKLRIVKGGIVKEVMVRAEVAPGSEVRAPIAVALNKVELWDQDHPNLYRAELSLGNDTLGTNFGIRKFEVQGTKLLLNGEPIKMGGANRPLDDPRFGSMDPALVLDKDLSMMKEGCMELSRINHYPLTEYQLDWADRNGLIFIEEAGNWQMTPKQMDDPLMRGKWQSQMREMVERDWNHASIMAWSVGNEYQSQTKSGQDWTKDMRDFTRTIDSSRLITFASMIVARQDIRKPEDEASQYVDFVSTNEYGGYMKNLQHIHELYPNKPIYMSEFGIRADQVKDESERVAHLKEAMAAFRANSEWLIGACVWTFNDYRSRFPGSNVNGYRPWGLVGPQRERRGMYDAWQEEFAPAIIERVSTQKVRITARKDFPSYTLKGYSLRGQGQTQSLRTLKPGESQELDMTSGELELIKPNGFIILKKNL